MAPDSDKIEDQKPDFCIESVPISQDKKSDNANVKRVEFNVEWKERSSPDWSRILVLKTKEREERIELEKSSDLDEIIGSIKDNVKSVFQSAKGNEKIALSFNNKTADRSFDLGRAGHYDLSSSIAGDMVARIAAIAVSEAFDELDQDDNDWRKRFDSFTMSKKYLDLNKYFDPEYAVGEIKRKVEKADTLSQKPYWLKKIDYDINVEFKNSDGVTIKEKEEFGKFLNPEKYQGIGINFDIVKNKNGETILKVRHVAHGSFAESQELENSSINLGKIDNAQEFVTKITQIRNFNFSGIEEITKNDQIINKESLQEEANNLEKKDKQDITHNKVEGLFYAGQIDSFTRDRLNPTLGYPPPTDSSERDAQSRPAGKLNPNLGSSDAQSPAKPSTSPTNSIATPSDPSKRGNGRVF